MSALGSRKWRPTGTEEWRALAACAAWPTSLFFPDDDGMYSAEQVNRAKAVCESCPSMMECREFAVRTRQEGIWGGLTEQGRRRIRRRRAA